MMWSMVKMLNVFLRKISSFCSHEVSCDVHSVPLCVRSVRWLPSGDMLRKVANLKQNRNIDTLWGEKHICARNHVSVRNQRCNYATLRIVAHFWDMWRKKVTSPQVSATTNEPILHASLGPVPEKKDQRSSYEYSPLDNAHSHHVQSGILLPHSPRFWPNSRSRRKFFTSYTLVHMNKWLGNTTKRCFLHPVRNKKL